jgi:tRNA A37 threonylcarbamoyladenosine synthetase subunit TsaC/SUA5/YrdC
MPLNPQLVYLVQTDTTAGFISQNPLLLASSKQRDAKQPFIICVDSLKTLNEFTRVPKKYKNLVRRSYKSTFIYPNNSAIRVVNDVTHKNFLKNLKWCYSSSANITRKNFDMNYAKQKADIIVEDARSFFEATPSSICKITNSKLRRLR